MRFRISRHLLQGIKFTLLLFGMMAVMASCGVYSFTGASISPEVKTISIYTFPNNAPLVNPALSAEFSNALRDKFIGQTTLDLVAANGDLHIEGEIINYVTQPVAIQGDETAALNRLTIAVNVRFDNKAEPEKSYQSKFSRFADYPSSSSLAEVESALIVEISEALIQDIFNKAVVNW